jgi:hypothetical protein
MRSSSTVPHITALLRTCCASLCSAILFSLCLLTHTTLSNGASFDHENASAILLDYSGTTAFFL